MLKPLKWLGSSLDDVREFPDDARNRSGFELYLVQKGEQPSDWKPMPSVGAGVQEIRVHVGGEYRVFYVAKFEDAIYVLHAFEKKARKTARRDLELARLRFHDFVRSRQQTQKGKV